MPDTLFRSSFALPTGSISTPATLCPSDVPLVLLPVRLETRFFPNANGSTELRVRVYPDRIHVDTHHPELTTDERTWGAQYWQQDWAAVQGKDRTARSDAWSTLASRFGPERAAWIVRVLQPANIANRLTDAQPAFPTLPPVGLNGESAWRTAPKARLLPDRWVAVLHSQGAVAMTVTGNPIAPDLNVGPDPTVAAPSATDEAAIAAGDKLAIDPGMAWMVDFTEAEAKGMGLRLTIPATMMGAKLDSLVVFGVAASLSGGATAAKLADLMDAHHYTDGLQFLPFGTPTNNTDDRRSGYNTEDPGHARSFEYEVEADPLKAMNAQRVGAALGLLAMPGRIASTLGHLAEADDDHERDQRSMNTALWEVGWGYYLSNMMGAETGLTPANIAWARRHFTRFVRSGGPFPALCFGRQPYGILPVTSLDLWAPGTGEPVTSEDTWLKNLLRNLREQVWRPALPSVARVGLRPGADGQNADPDSDLVDVMGVDGVSHSYLSRPVFGRHYLEHLYQLSADSFSAVAQAQDALAGGPLNLLPSPLPQRPHLSHGFHWDLPSLVTAPLVQAGEISPWRKLDDPTNRNYIATLLGITTVQGLIDSRPAWDATNSNRSLLEMLLRHAMLREVATTAARILSANAASLPGLNLNLATLLRDLELVDLVSTPPSGTAIPTPPKSFHWQRQLDQPVPKAVWHLPNDRSPRQYLETSNNNSARPLRVRRRFRQSLDYLKDLDSERLQFLAQGTLDLSSHRLDAWITSYATKRLRSMTTSNGVHVGAYGWVENLIPASPLLPLPATQVPTGEQTPVYPLPKDSGFIHAPSVAHASAAALLRNAHLSPAALVDNNGMPTGVPTAASPFAIDLSSRRVREATRLLDGVRQGQPLTALLGYRLERRLHDLKLDAYIAALRSVAPLAVREREPGGAPTEALAANNVVDALTLVQIRQKQAALLTGQPKPDDVKRLDDALGKVSGTGTDQVRREIDALLDSVDGLSDALVAETAYQMARGNSARLGSTLAAIAQGDAPPPELEVARTPRTGNAITHRTLVMFSGASNVLGGWTNTTKRSVLEPWLNAWIRAQLGDARTIRCTVEQLDDVSGAVVRTAKFALSDLSMSPLDFLYNVPPAGQSKDVGASLSIAEQLVLYHARRMTGGFDAGATLRVQHDRPTDLPTGSTTLFDALEEARTIRRLLDGARGMRPEDVSPPDGSSLGTIDLAELESRVVQYEGELNSAHSGLSGLVTGTIAAADDIRTAMLRLGSLGVGPFVPNNAVGDTPDIRTALAQQAIAMLKVSKQRLDQSNTLKAHVAATDQSARCDQLLDRARAVYGNEFVSLPNFTLNSTSAAELNSALAASTQQQGGDPLAVHSWFARSSRVRDKLASLGRCMLGAEVLASGTRLSLSVAQLPFKASERWVGLPPLDGGVIPPSKLSLVVQPLTAIDATKPLCGLFIDEWVEVVPNQTETTALAFQFDPPNSFAPQNVLVAVPPVPGQAWTTETLRRVLLETLDLAKLRAVDPSRLGPAAQYLPALYVPFNAEDNAVSTDFAPLTA